MGLDEILDIILSSIEPNYRPGGLMRRSPNLSQQLWRLRGVLAVGALILLLFVLIFRNTQGPGDLAQINEQEQYSNLQSVVAQSPELQYAVVFDAGSSGSRVHVYEFQSGENGQFSLKDELFEQLKPGLSSYAGNPQEAADSLQPLIDKSIERVPESQRSSTYVVLKATAGLRMLEGNQAQEILDLVKQKLSATGFQVPLDGVEIMDGSDEGAFAWLTLNYLLGTLGGSSTVAAIDLGGGSVQQAFSVDDESAQQAPEGYIKTVSYGPNKFNVYVHSYLNFGLLAARAEVLKSSSEDGSHCLLADASGSYKYNNLEYALKSSGANFQECSEGIENVLDADAQSCTFDKCSFSGAWAVNTVPQTDMYISSFFFDRAVDSGIITDSTLPTANIKVQDYKTKGQIACSENSEAVQTEFQNIEADLVPYLCLDLSYCYTLLKDGFDISEDQDITLVKRINYNGMEIEAAWPLGAALGLLSAPPQQQ
eukprot:TRINITY_DN3613_c0_g1_i1.p1 TRINITY_DN3613_c0_g1~~TRINITY_DN3613_c0_g1_i1.p1  ORF type:complete len:482 (-),score=89.00 TRINITY_DN3613_c0_g1_i1:410-1855(-)